MRFHPQVQVRRHGRDQIHGLLLDGLGHHGSIAKAEAKQRQHAARGLLVQGFTAPEPVADPSGHGIESDVPGEFCIAQLSERLDHHIGSEQVGNPVRHGFCKCLRSARSGGEIETHVELVAAVPIVLGVIGVEHVDLRLSGRAQHRHQRQHRRHLEPANDLLVPKKQRLLVEHDPLRPEKQFSRAQDHMNELIDEQRRQRDRSRANQREIGGFQRRLSQQEVAEGEHELPILPRIGIGDRGNFVAAGRPARVGEQFAV